MGVLVGAGVAVGTGVGMGVGKGVAVAVAVGAGSVTARGRAVTHAEDEIASEIASSSAMLMLRVRQEGFNKDGLRLS